MNLLVKNLVKLLIEIKFLKDAAMVYKLSKEFIQAPVETTKQVVNALKTVW